MLSSVALQIKPMLAIWRVERETKEKQAEIDKLKTKFVNLESERDALQESENLLSEKVSLSALNSFTLKNLLKLYPTAPLH